MKRLGRLARALGVPLALALIAGSGYEWFARHAARRDFPPPGRLVDIGGRRIQLDCRGTGTPIVVLESGLDIGGSTAWSAVHDSLASITRTCAYSRAGIMWSDEAPGATTPKGVADDLHATLVAAGETPPYVLVGHSLGGPYTMIYTKYYGADVAGMVMVDASHPEQEQRFAALSPKLGTQSLGLWKFLSALSWTGAWRVLTSGNVPMPNQSASVAHAVHAYTPTSFAATLKEGDALTAVLAEAGTFRHLGDRPLFVLTANKPPTAAELAATGNTAAKDSAMRAVWRGMQDDEATWSTRSQHRVLDDASHYIQYWRPDAVIDAVRSVVYRARAGAPVEHPVDRRHAAAARHDRASSSSSRSR